MITREEFSNKNRVGVLPTYPEGEGRKLFDSFCRALNPRLEASTDQCYAALWELRLRFYDKYEERAGWPDPKDRPRIQFLDIAKFLNTCKSE